MEFRLKRKLSYVSGVFVAVVLVGACGDADSGESSAGEQSPQPTPTAQWQQTDVCGLLSDQEARDYLRGQEATGRKQNKSDATGGQRPGCGWQAGSQYKLDLALWQPPAPGVQSENAERTLDVNGKKGYVTSQTEVSCTVDVEAEPAWLQVITFSPRPEDETSLTERTECDRAGELAGTVLDRLTK